MNLYLKLFHGRCNPDKSLDDWGEDGPIFHVDRFVHTTYASDIKFDELGGRSECELVHVEDMVYYDGWYYGDWSVFAKTLDSGEQAMLQRFDPAKAKPPKPPAKSPVKLPPVLGRPDRADETLTFQVGDRVSNCANPIHGNIAYGVLGTVVDVPSGDIGGLVMVQWDEPAMVSTSSLEKVLWEPGQ